MSRLPNYQIVLNALQSKEGERTIELTNGMTIGWVDSTLCQILHVWKESDPLNDEPDETQWVRLDLPVNDFIQLCEQLPEETIVNLVFGSAMAKMHNSPFNPNKWENEDGN